ncbi:hypothetical protein PL321_07050 [Caloramator sp. mosi_1]|uniref:hypothetical protein n=1 Tax=Caloramator sp. mosi_1 TaxID=3023090 RepID=UPI002360B6C6|nr:hypothetical protein [Caloramator sp. mosi_1]WDC85212.1 hypothetical protein PL321_07050 [Caloramator sp. mosi_1]
MYYQALLLSYYFGLNITVTASKTLNINNIDVLFNGEYKNVYLNKVLIKNLTNIKDIRQLKNLSMF